MKVLYIQGGGPEGDNTTISNMKCRLIEWQALDKDQQTFIIWCVEEEEEEEEVVLICEPWC